MTRVWSGAVLLALAVAPVWTGARAAVSGGCRSAPAARPRRIRATGSRLRRCDSSRAGRDGRCPDLRGVGGGLAAFGLPLDVILMLAFVALAGVAVATWRGGRDALSSTAAAVLPTLYLGLPIGRDGRRP